MKKAAVIPCKGIGDGLIMMVAAFALYKREYEVTIFHPALEALKDWFFPAHFKKWDESAFEELSSYAMIIVQNDNSPFLLSLKRLQKEGLPLHVLYPTYEKGKHDITSMDVVLDSHIPIAQGIQRAMQSLLQDSSLTADNGIIPPLSFTYRANKKRVLLHPTSTATDRTWSKKKFLETFKSLEMQGYDPYLVVGPDEIKEWKVESEKGYKVVSFVSLSSLAGFIYESGYLVGNESGLSHLASNLAIPTLVIAGHRKRIMQWQPGWNLVKVLYPSPWIPNPKALRLRDRYWQKWISLRKVKKGFADLLCRFDQLK